MRTAAVLLFLILLAPLARAQDDEITNPMCPVMTDQEVSEDLYLEYRGVRVYVCCEDCVDKFQENPERYEGNLPASLVAQMIPVEKWKKAGGWDYSEPSHAEQHATGVLHPILIHFPLALSAVAALTALLGLLISKSFFRNMTTLLLILAAASIVPSFLTGQEAEEARGAMADSLHERVEAHEEMGLVAMYVVLAAALLQVLSYTKPLDKSVVRIAALVLILGAAGTAGYAGYLGGEVIRGPDHLQHILPF